VPRPPLLLVLPLTAAALLPSLLAPRLADALAVTIARRLQPLSVLAPSRVASVDSSDSSDEAASAEHEAESVTLEVDSAVSSKPARGKARRGAPVSASHSVSVSAATVLELAESGARPRGKPVGATAQRPAGLRLSGVSALGIGVEDGDVLTEAAGVPALDASGVIERRAW
jgi:hypothetical protein